MRERPLRIMQITGAYPPLRCGVGRYTSIFAATLADAGHEVAVFSCGPDASPERPAGVEFLPMPQRLDRVPLGLIRRIRRWAPDVIHMQYPSILPVAKATAGWLTLWLRIRRMGPRVVTLHEPPGRPSPHNLALLLGAQRFIIVKPHALDDTPAWLGAVVRRKPVNWIQNASMLPRQSLDERHRAEIKQRYGAGDRQLIVTFGFLTPANMTEWLFEIADPSRHQLVVAGQVPDGFHEHRRKIESLCAQSPWRDRVVRTGFVPEQEAAELLAAADAVVLPFRDGGGNWNTSLHAALQEGSFVLATSKQHTGYDAEQNLYFAAPGDLDDMRQALHSYAGRRIDDPDPQWDWSDIRDRHVDIYHQLLSPPR